MCAPGTEGDGVTCVDCVLSYQPDAVAGNVTCTLFPPNTNAPNRATSVSDCKGMQNMNQIRFDWLKVNFSIDR